MTTEGRFGIRGDFEIGPILSGARQVDNALQNTTRQVQALNTQSRGLTQGLSNLFSRPAQQLIFLGLDVQQFARSLALLSAPIIAADAASLKFAIDFQNALVDVNSLLLLSDTNLEKVGNRVRDLARDPSVVQGPTELAKALKFLISSGFDTSNAFGVLRTASIGATAGNADLTTVTQALAGVLNALPRGTITAQDALDTMFQTVKDGIIEFNQLAATQGQVLGALSATGISFQEAGAAIATITRAGIPADLAMTSLNRVLLSFIAPSKQAKDEAAKLGIEFDQNSLATKGLAASLGEIVRATHGDTEALSALFGDIRALRGVLALTRNDTQDFVDLLDSQRHASDDAGAAAAALEQQLKKPGAQLQLLKRDFENVGVTIGEDFLKNALAVLGFVRGLAVDFSQLPEPLRRSAEGLGLVIAAGSGLTFIIGNIITSAGAVLNFFRQLNTLAAGSAVSLEAVATAQRALAATGVLSTLQTNLVTAQEAQVAALAAAGVSQVAVGRSLSGRFAALTPEITAANAAVRQAELELTSFDSAALGAAVATQKLTIEASAGTVGVAGLVSTLGKLTIAGLVAGGIVLLTNSLLDFVVNARIAGKSAEDLAKQLEDLTKPKGASFGDALVQFFTGGFKGVDSLLDQANDREIARIKELFSQGLTPATAAAIRQAQAANEEAAAQAEQSLPQITANLTKALADSVNDPELHAKIAAGLERVQAEGAQAITESGFDTLSKGQQALIIKQLNFLESQKQTARSAGNEIAAAAFEGIENRLVQETGFNIPIPVNLQATVSPEIAAEQKAISQLTEQEKAAVADLNAELERLKKADDLAKIAQLELNLVMLDAQRAFKAAQDAVAALKDQLQDAEDRLNNLGQHKEVGVKFVLAGIPEIEDQIFAVGQQLTGIQLQILTINSSFTPQIFDAQEEVLRTRLALLQAGDAAEALGRKASFGIEDLINAQQRELREGVPVLRTIFEKIQAAASGQGGAAAKTPEQQAADAASRRLEILQTENQLATIQLQKQEAIARNEQERLNLTKELTFAPQLRELEKLITLTKEVTFDEAVKGLQQARTDVQLLNEQLATANQVLLDRKAVVDDLSQKEQDLQKAALGRQIEEAKLLQQISDLETKLGFDIAPHQEHLDILTAIANTKAPIPEPAPLPPPRGGNIGFDTRFGVEQPQLGQDEIDRLREVIATSTTATAQSLQAADDAAGGIAGIFEKLLAALGRLAAPLDQAQTAASVFHAGGAVAPALPSGVEVPAVLQAGEHVLSRAQVHIIRSQGIDPSHIHEVVSHMLLMPRFHAGGPVGQISAPAPAQLIAAPMSAPIAMIGAPSQTYNWHVTINNSSSAGDPYAKLVREGRMRRLAGRW